MGKRERRSKRSGGNGHVDVGVDMPAVEEEVGAGGNALPPSGVDPTAAPGHRLPESDGRSSSGAGGDAEEGDGLLQQPETAHQQDAGHRQNVPPPPLPAAVGPRGSAPPRRVVAAADDSLYAAAGGLPLPVATAPDHGAGGGGVPYSAEYDGSGDSSSGGPHHHHHQSQHHRGSRGHPHHNISSSATAASTSDGPLYTSNNVSASVAKGDAADCIDASAFTAGRPYRAVDGEATSSSNAREDEEGEGAGDGSDDAVVVRCREEEQQQHGGAAGLRRGKELTEREESNALPRMLRLQQTFESNMSKLYRFCATHVTEWPSLAVEWIPDRKFADPERDYTLQYVAVGTQTAKGAANQLRVMEVAVPAQMDSDVMYALQGDDDIDGGEGGSDGAAAGGGGATGAEEVEVDPGKLFKNVRGHFRCEQAITLDAPVLKVRAMPLESNIVAVTTGSGFIGVYNLVQEQREDDEGVTTPDAVLCGHRMGGFGLSWNHAKPGLIASGADDGYIGYWDVAHHITVDLDGDSADAAGGASPDAGGRDCQPLQRLSGHRDIVTDVSWHCTQGHLLASASLDGDVRVWDIRTSGTAMTMNAAHPEGGATAAQFHPVGAFQLATAGGAGELCFWDIRRPRAPLLELAYHGRAVTGLQWAPFMETVIVSFGEDGRVVVWDLAKTSLPLEYSSDAMAPPEVSFVHIGHMGAVTDARWCGGRGDDWLLASADAFNGFHVYEPKRSVVMDYEPERTW